MEDSGKGSMHWTQTSSWKVMCLEGVWKFHSPSPKSHPLDLFISIIFCFLCNEPVVLTAWILWATRENLIEPKEELWQSYSCGLKTVNYPRVNTTTLSWPEKCGRNHELEVFSVIEPRGRDWQRHAKLCVVYNESWKSSLFLLGTVDQSPW